MVRAKLKTTTKGQLMSHQYNPTVTETADAYSVAFGVFDNAMLIGAMWARLTKQQQEVVYAEAINKVKADLKEKELV